MDKSMVRIGVKRMVALYIFDKTIIKASAKAGERLIQWITQLYIQLYKEELQHDNKQYNYKNKRQTRYDSAWV
jgi:hypothetical protein